MGKTEFLARLRERLAARMDGEELENALSYYEEYFDDAGPEREEEAAAELGSPETVADQVLEVQGGGFRGPARRGGHGWVIALCVGLGALFMAGVLYLALSFGRAPIAPPSPPAAPFVPAAPSAPAIPSAPVAPSAPAAPSKPAVTVDGETASVEDLSLEAFTKLSVECPIGEVVLETGSGYTLTMDWQVNSADMRYANEDGRLKIWSAKTGGGNNQRGGTIRVTVPEDAELEKADLWTGLGDVKATGVTVRELELLTGLGGVKVSGVTAEEVDAESGLGDIDVELTGAKKDYGIELDAGVGSVEVDGKKIYGSSYEAEQGRYQLDCATGLGDIRVRFSED